MKLRLTAIAKTTIKAETVKHIPLRRCVACWESKIPAELIRFYLSGDKWKLDEYHLMCHQKNSIAKLVAKPSGRGAWVCIEQKCHTLKKLKRFFKGQTMECYKMLIDLPSEKLSRNDSDQCNSSSKE